MNYTSTIGSLPVRQSDPRVAEGQGALLFSGTLFAGALLLQRFGINVGTTYLDAVTPVGMGLAALFVLNGTLVFHRGRVMIFTVLSVFVFVGATTGALVPNLLGGNPSTTSLGQFLVLSSFATLTFARPIGERSFFCVVNNCIAVVAVAGLVEFFMQLADVELFTFTELLPSSILVEPYWHVIIPIEGTQLFKSNGFFLLEPSLFSQYTALALLIEILVLRRTRYLCLFGAALVSSVSGTGWLMILGFGATAVFSMGGHGVVLAAMTGAVGATALGGLALASPDVYHFLIGRTDEFTDPGSSGFLRFVTPWWVASDVLSASPLVSIVGLGAGVSDHPARVFAYEYNSNSIVKLLLDFGAPVLIAFLSLFVASRTKAQNALIAPIMIWLLWDGTNVEIPFILLPCMLLLITADLIPATQTAR